MAFNVRFQFVGVRVDDDAVINAFDKTQRQAFNRIGGTIRKIAGRSIRKQTKAVLDGRKEPKKNKPPRWRKRGPGTLKDGIFFGVDLSAGDLIVGPILSSSRRQKGQTVPEFLEFGDFPYMGPALELAVELDEVAKAIEQFA